MNKFTVFPDGWDFTPDVGNGKTRGEIFTPRFIVDQMIEEGYGIFPQESVREGNYCSSSYDEAYKVMSSRVVEPAVGTANFSSTILWHKLQYACEISKSIPELYMNFLIACGSVYCFDIDPGNLSTTIRRFLGHNDYTKKFTSVDYWVERIAENLEGKNNTEENRDIIRKYVSKSLDDADRNWLKFFTEDGVIQKVWKNNYTKKKGADGFEQLEEEIPKEVMNAIVEVFENNVKIFNGISDVDAVSDSFVMPGSKYIVWVWWNFSLSSSPSSRSEGENPVGIKVSKKLNSFTLQKIKEEKEKLRQEWIQFKKDHCREESHRSLFSDFEHGICRKWDSKSNQNKSLKMLSQLNNYDGKMLQIENRIERVEERLEYSIPLQ